MFWKKTVLRGVLEVANLPVKESGNLIQRGRLPALSLFQDTREVISSRLAVPGSYFSESPFLFFKKALVCVGGPSNWHCWELKNLTLHRKSVRRIVPVGKVAASTAGPATWVVQNGSRSKMLKCHKRRADRHTATSKHKTHTSWCL